jgi:hypothetical protein
MLWWWTCMLLWRRLEMRLRFRVLWRRLEVRLCL